METNQSSLEQFIAKNFKKIKLTKNGIEEFKRKFCQITSQNTPKSSFLLKAYQNLVRQNKVPDNKKLVNLLSIRKVRSQSGVVPVAVFTPQLNCPGKCLYCPHEPGIPKSYLSSEPAVERAKMAHFDPSIQLTNRIKQLEQIGHMAEKIELIVMGATFSAFPFKERRDFIKKCLLTLNNLGSQPKAKSTKTDSLSKLQKINQSAKYKMVGLSIETRPDYLTPEEIKFLRLLGVTKVELGVQSLRPEVLKKNLRGHGISEIIKATKLLRSAGLKICYHIMPNLYGSTPTMDLAVFKKLFSDHRFQPDMLKIYPCVVLKNAPLYKLFKQHKYQPYPFKDLIELLVKIKTIIPEYVRINRLYRDIPSQYVQGGTKTSNLRQVVQQTMKSKNLQCQCIRCREIKNNKLSANLLLKIISYKVNGGTEYFLQYVDKDNRLYSLLRLFLPKSKINQIFPELNDSALIRELHTFGRAVAIGQKKATRPQHKGLGKKLIRQAEKIASQHGYPKIAVTSGIGTRNYYAKMGYSLQKFYQQKKL